MTATSDVAAIIGNTKILMVAIASPEKEELSGLLRPMQVPSTRRDLSQRENTMWLQHNLRPLNAGAPGLRRALALLRKINEERVSSHVR